MIFLRNLNCRDFNTQINNVALEFFSVGTKLGALFVSMDVLLRKSDFVIVCAPLTNETENMCDDEFFFKMKRTAVFVNIGRGQVVDQEALKRALRNKTIFAAGIDVMTPEPLSPNDDLLHIPNLGKYKEYQ